MSMQQETYKDDKYDSLLDAISANDKEAQNRFDKATKEGKTIRIM